MGSWRGVPGDAHLGDLERRWLASGDPADEAAFRQEAARQGADLLRAYDGLPGCRCPECGRGPLRDPDPGLPPPGSISDDGNGWVESTYSLQCDVCFEVRRDVGRRRALIDEEQNDYTNRVASLTVRRVGSQLVLTREDAVRLLGPGGGHAAPAGRAPAPSPGAAASAHAAAPAGGEVAEGAAPPPAAAEPHGPPGSEDAAGPGRPLELRLVPRGDPRRCVFCHDDLGRARRFVCRGCSAAYHPECRTDLRECAVEGCGVAPARFRLVVPDGAAEELPTGLAATHPAAGAVAAATAAAVGASVVWAVLQAIFAGS